MEDCFSCITPAWLNRAYVFTGSIGRPSRDFRYRLAQDEKAKMIHATTYSKVCYELAEDKNDRDFSWDESGVEALKACLQSEYEAFVERQGGIID